MEQGVYIFWPTRTSCRLQFIHGFIALGRSFDSFVSMDIWDGSAIGISTGTIVLLGIKPEFTRLNTSLEH